MLELVPPRRRSSKQKALLQVGSAAANDYPMYRLLQEPSSLDEVLVWDIRQTSHYTLWREKNQTLICLGDMDLIRYRGKHVFFTICYHKGRRQKLDCAIYGKTDAAIAETASFLWALQSLGKNEACFTIGGSEADDFDFTALQVHQLAYVLDANPTRRFEFKTGTWDAEQTVVLATRSYPFNLKLTSKKYKRGFQFKDDGDAFVAALTTRQSSFGSLGIDFDKDEALFSRKSLKLLFQFGIFEALSTCVLDRECVLLPFSAKADILDYKIDAQHVQPADFGLLNITAKDLTLKLYLDHTNDWDGLLISFWNRMAELGHFEKINFSFAYFWEDTHEDPFEFSEVAPVVQALMRAIKNNLKLTHLNLSDTHFRFNWNPHIQEIFLCMEEHGELRTFTIKRYPDEDPTYSWLKRLLSCNRNITVLDRSGQRCSNGSIIDRLYKLNHFHNGLITLVKESAPLRPLLVGTALVESASEDAQLTALLFSSQMDVLCEFVQDLNLENSVAT